MSETTIAGLDIGTQSIRLVIGQISESSHENQLKIIGAITVPASGINKGVVANIEDATSTIALCLDKAERLIGVPISSVWVGVNSPNINCDRSKGVVAVSKSDGEIREEDVDRVIEAARAFSLPPNHQLIHVFPVGFNVDGQTGVKNPVGMHGVRLEADTIVVRALTSEINNLTKAIYRTGLDIDDLVLSPLATADAVLTSRHKDLGVALIVIGAATTSVTVFEEGELLHSVTLKVGSEDITKDLAIGLRCPMELAEKIKEEFGSVEAVPANRKDEIDISHLVDERESVNKNLAPISRKYLAEIIEARVEEIFEKVDKELKKIGRSGMLPGGIVLTGGGIKIKGIINTAKNKLRLPVIVGVPHGVEAVIEKANDPQFITALGLVVWGSKTESKRSGMQIGKVIKNSFAKTKSWFSSLMP